MADEVPSWIGRLALDVHKVIQRFHAMARFRTMIENWFSKHKEEEARRNRWEEERRKHFEERVAPSDGLKSREAAAPEEGWRYELYLTHRPRRASAPDGWNLIEIWGWVPPHLSASKRPEVHLPLPLTREHALSLEEKYVCLAAVYECGRKGTEAVPPWPWPREEEWGDPKTFENVLKSFIFELLVQEVSKLSEDHEGWFRTFIDDVRADLDKAETRESPSPDHESAASETVEGGERMPIGRFPDPRQVKLLSFLHENCRGSMKPIDGWDATTLAQRLSIPYDELAPLVSDLEDRGYVYTGIETFDNPVGSVVINSAGRDLVNEIAGRAAAAGSALSPACVSGKDSQLSMIKRPKERNVFVVHGRNKKVRDFIFNFLRALDLYPVPWDTAKRMTGKQGSNMRKP